MKDSCEIWYRWTEKKKIKKLYEKEREEQFKKKTKSSDVQGKWERTEDAIKKTTKEILIKNRKLIGKNWYDIEC